MIIRTGSGWQTVMADLALILFLVTAQAYREPDREPAPATQARTPPHAEQGPQLAVFRPDEGADLKAWLVAQLTDDRQGVTVVIRTPDADLAPALLRGGALVERIAKEGIRARLIVEPSNRPDTAVVIAYDTFTMDGTQIAAQH